MPDRLVSNEQIAAALDVDADWIAKRTGTRERPWASPDERLSQLAELDLVLVATSRSTRLPCSRTLESAAVPQPSVMPTV